MLALIVGVALGVAIAVFVYIGRERLGGAGWGLALLRAVAFSLLVILLVNPTATRAGSDLPPTVLLDASLSMGDAGGQWTRARDTALALAGARGLVLRFGDRVTSYDSAAPTDGGSLLAPALRAAVGRGGPVFVVTDGELADGGALPPTLRSAATVIRLPRDTVPDAALLDVATDPRAGLDDSVAIAIEIGTWGRLTDTAGTLDITEGNRRLARRRVALPPSPGVARTVVTLPPHTLAAGTHVLAIALHAPGDAEPGDDTRLRIVHIAAAPPVVVTVDPAEWEGKFLVRELGALTQTPVAGYAKIGLGGWIDMRTEHPVSNTEVADAVRRAAVVVAVGRAGAIGRRPAWRWPATAPGASVDDGDWYVRSDPNPSPLAGRLSGVMWDSLPPLAGALAVVPPRAAWIALDARRGRQGAARPIVFGRDSAGVRELVTAGTGLWRWALQGGAPLEAYRTLVASGMDWLLSSEAIHAPARLTAAAAVERGTPVIFRWHRDSVPAPIAVTLAGDTLRRTDTLRFGADRAAEIALPPGVYHWSAGSVPGAGGIVAVEPYSDEYHPGSVTLSASSGAREHPTHLIGARSRWWLFALVIVALVGEWAWRTRKGLP
ncbi:MAG TPA: hypothetical protein VJ992_10730 [Gemmatimonadales bacterium]|nr:hypothetical protein [Gemmatimonadales bacterium]